MARIYGLNYFLVVTPSEDLKLDEIRFQYMHFLLDPLAAKYAAEIEQKAVLRATGQQAPMLGLDFKEDFGLLVTECLIRALELRMDKVPAADAQKKLDEMTSQGLILVHYFYDSLLAFEHQDASMTTYYKPMILAIDIRSGAAAAVPGALCHSPARPRHQGGAGEVGGRAAPRPGRQPVFPGKIPGGEGLLPRGAGKG